MSQILTGLAVLIALLMVLEGVRDGVDHRRILADEHNPALSIASLQADEAWLENYFVSPPYRHIIAKRTFLRSSLASKTLERIRSKKDEVAWTRVVEASDTRIKANRAEVHLQEFRQCPHSSQADLLATAGKESENLDYLQKITSELEKLPENDPQAETKVQGKLDQIEVLPQPSALTVAVHKERESLRNDLLERLKKIKICKDDVRWRTFRAEVLDLLRQKKVGPAAVKLASWDPNDQRMKELLGIFDNQCVPIVTDQVEQDLKSRAWSAARDTWKSAHDDVAVTKLLGPAQLQALESLGRRIEEAQDRGMYDQIRKNPGNRGNYVDQYLKSASLGRMRKVVSAYKTYLDQINGPLDLKLVLQQIEWGDARNNETHEVRITVDGKPLIETSLTACRLSRTGQVGPAAEIHKAPFDEIRIQIKVVQKAWVIGWDHDAGTGEYTGTVSGLKNGKKLDLVAPDHTNWATFVVTGFPEEPRLPEWGEN